MGSGAQDCHPFSIGQRDFAIMEPMSNQSHLPSSAALTSALVLGLLCGLLSLGGLLFPEHFYPTPAVRTSFRLNDTVSLLVNLPALSACIYLARKGRIIGALLLPGAALATAYNAVAYLVVLPFPFPAMLYIGELFFCALTLYRLHISLDLGTLGKSLAPILPNRLIGGILIGLGLPFFLMQVSALFEMISAGLKNSPELGTAAADLVTAPLWVIFGILLWQKRPLGLAGGVGLLFQACLMFCGLLVYFLLLPISAQEPFPAQDFAVIAGMSLVCLIPFGTAVLRISRHADRL